MCFTCVLTVVAMLLFPTGQEPDNPWKDKVAGALQRAEEALEEALDVVWRADDWQAGLRLARAALAASPQRPELRGRIVRALWRAGRIEEAERLAAEIPAHTDDRVALRALIVIHLARGENQRAGELAARLEALESLTADDLLHVFAARLALKQAGGRVDLLRRIERLTDARNGYPEIYIAESIDGVAAFLDAVGPRPLNQIDRYGAARMSALVMFNLPSCEAFINGGGPYRLVLDTGGSIMVSLDEKVAEEIGLKSVARASVRGVSGKQETGQALLDELQIGTITCKRVMARTFDVRGALMNAADGIIGTGIFADGRMMLDFANGQLVISRSQAAPAAGEAVELRLVADAKLMTPVTLAGQPAVALLDTAADVVALAPSRLRQIFPAHKIQKLPASLGIGIGSSAFPDISLNPGVDLVFAGRKLENYGGLGLDVLDTTLGPMLGVQSDILIGMPMFRETKSCTVDFPRCKMWVDWLSR